MVLLVVSLSGTVAGSVRAEMHACTGEPGAALSIVDRLTEQKNHAADVRILRDPTGDMDFQMAEDALAAGKFGPQCGFGIAPATSGGAQWVALRWRTTVAHPGQWVLRLTSSQVDSFEVWWRRSDRAIAYRKSGRAIDAAERDLVTARPSVSIDFVPDIDQTLLIRVAGGQAPALGFELIPAAVHRATVDVEFLVFVAFTVLLAIMTGFNLLRYAVNRSALRLFYCLYVAALATNNAIWEGTLYRLYSGAWDGRIMDALDPVTAAVATLAFVEFSRRLLQLADEAPRWDGALRWLLFAQLVCLAICLVDFQVGARAQIGATIVTWIVIFYSSLRLTISGRRQAKVFTIALICQLAGMLPSLITIFSPGSGFAGGDEFLSKVIYFSYYIGFALEIVGMSIAIGWLSSENRAALAKSTSRPVSDHPIGGLGPDPQAFLVKIRQFVTDHLDDPNLGVRELAAGMAMTETTLRRRLNEATAQSPGVFIRSLRLQRAQQLVNAGSYATANEIAHAVGFTNVGHFARLYKEHFGATPAMVLRQNRQDSEQQVRRVLEC